MGTANYVFKRLLQYFAVLFIGLTITFALPRLMPVNPVDGYIGELQSRANATLDPEAIAELRENLETLYGLRGSIFEQYFGFMKRVILHLDFGPSFTYYPLPVADMLVNALPWTLCLLMTATIIAWMLGNAVGIVAGYFHKRKLGTVLEVVGIMLYPIPYYVIAILTLMIFAYIFPIFPLSATFPTGDLTWAKFGKIVYNSLLPGFALVIAGFGWNILSMKALAVATGEEAYVTFARLKGTSNRTRMIQYVFRNALLPQVTALALSLGVIFNGALLTEIIFSYPGIGLVLRQAAGSGDYNVLYGALCVSVFAVATATLIIDLIYPILDPRIRRK